MVIYVATSADLKARLNNSQYKIVVVDFFATWCAPCRMIAPQFDTLAEQNPDILFLKFDIDNADVGDDYDVSSLPTFIIFQNGEIVDRFSGANIKKVEEMVGKIKLSAKANVN